MTSLNTENASISLTTTVLNLPAIIDATLLHESNGGLGVMDGDHTDPKQRRRNTVLVTSCLSAENTAPSYAFTYFRCSL